MDGWVNSICTFCARVTMLVFLSHMADNIRLKYNSAIIGNRAGVRPGGQAGWLSGRHVNKRTVGERTDGQTV